MREELWGSLQWWRDTWRKTPHYS